MLQDHARSGRAHSACGAMGSAGRSSGVTAGPADLLALNFPNDKGSLRGFSLQGLGCINHTGKGSGTVAHPAPRRQLVNS